MANAFSEPSWTPKQVLAFWENEYENLNSQWREDFLSNEYVQAMCLCHPEHIRIAIQVRKKVKEALAYIYEIQENVAGRNERLLDDFHPRHAIGITNAHHGVRTTDPFDPKRDDLLFKCVKCNLKLSLLRKSKIVNLENTCKTCTGEE